MKRIYNKHFPTFHKTCKKVNCRPETLEEKKKSRHRQGHGLTGTCKALATDKNYLDCAVKKATSKIYKTFKYPK